MKMILWCNEKKGCTPRDLDANPEFRARRIGYFDVEFPPRKGEEIQLRDDDDDDSCYEVTTVVHQVNRRALYVEIEWVEP